jgi:hypothetical protein
MPHVNINSAGSDDIRTTVSWGPDYVQVTTATKKHHPMTPDAPEHDEFITGAHVNLDRAGCNRLIRAVRQGRDAGYGADA